MGNKRTVRNVLLRCIRGMFLVPASSDVNALRFNSLLHILLHSLGLFFSGFDSVFYYLNPASAGRKFKLKHLG